jgi:hypothetical protein
MAMPDNPGDNGPVQDPSPFGTPDASFPAQEDVPSATQGTTRSGGADGTGSSGGGSVVDGGGPSPLVWVIGALAAIAVVIGGFIVFGNSNSKDDGTPPPPAAVSVPSVVGFTLEEATKSIEGLGLTVGDISQIPSDQPNGIVLEQNPISGTQLVEGSRIDLIVAAEPLPIVPDVEMMKEQEAINTLLAAGLRPGKIKKINSPEPAGEVLAQHPKAGATVEPGAEINLTISNGKTGVPDVLGMTQAEAEANLMNAGFKFVVQEVEAQDRVGLVVGMNPQAGVKAKAGTTVTITVVKAAAPLPTPTVSPTPSPKPSPTIGGQAKCDLPTFTEFVEPKQEAQGVPLQKINDFSCDNGWAVVIAQVGAPGQTLIKRFILEAEGQFWVQRKQASACSPGSSLPDSLRTAACEPLVG